MTQAEQHLLERYLTATQINANAASQLCRAENSGSVRINDDNVEDGGVVDVFEVKP